MSESEIKFTAHNFQQFLDEGKLMACRCPACQAIYLPVRALCPKCFQPDLDWIELSGRGKLSAYTSVYIGPTFMNEEGFGRDKPYLTGIVELEEGPNISARLIGLDPGNPAEVKIGTPLFFMVVKIGEGENERAQLAFQPEGGRGSEDAKSQD
ncbi:MAG: Zn-ribbon domain-containing OB-fold protein [Anaerolineales bacterium]|nr:Zn-ribbon domain-containing OB-fold protein [Anaerolineales bacterium]